MRSVWGEWSGCAGEGYGYVEYGCERCGVGVWVLGMRGMGPWGEGYGCGMRGEGYR